MGRSTTVMKSVPSPGSPLQIPFSFSSRTPSVCLLWSFTFACNWAKRSCCSSFDSSCVPPEANSASGMKSGVGSVLSCAGCSSLCTFSSATSAFSALALASASAIAASSASAASAASSAFDLRPRFLGAGFAGSSSAATGSVGSAGFSGISLKSGVVSAVGLFFLTSKFSPSLPFTVYTWSSFFAIRVRLRLAPIGFLLA